MIFDLHNDILTTKKLSRCEIKDILFRYHVEQRAKKIVLAAWTSDLTDPLQQIPDLFSILNETPDFIDKFFFAIEDLHFLNNENIASFLEWKDRYNILYAGLTWNHENILCGGALSGGRLTEFGKSVIIELEKADIIIDTAHLNKNSFWDVINHSNKTVINSHCCFDGVHANLRNIDDNQIKAILERDGIIGLTLVPKFLSANPSNIIDVFKHIDYFTCKFGYENLAIGTDFYGTTEYLDNFISYSDFDKLASILQSYGYLDEEISAIFYKNAEKFFLFRSN